MYKEFIRERRIKNGGNRDVMTKFRQASKWGKCHFADVISFDSFD